MTLTLSTQIPPTRRRKHCESCGTIIPSKTHICLACAELNERIAVASRWERAICAWIADVDTSGSVRFALDRIIRRSGFSSPVILAAIANRVAYLSPITYPEFEQIVNEETAGVTL